MNPQTQVSGGLLTEAKVLKKVEKWLLQTSRCRDV
jgi:hypothetical protein